MAGHWTTISCPRTATGTASGRRVNAARRHCWPRFSTVTRSAVRVGQALGRRDPDAAALSGWVALLLGVTFMSTMSVAIALFARPIALIFTKDPDVIRAAVTLLFFGAIFQVFDGIQTVATGALRGAGDTRTPMLCHFVCYWLIGLPIGAYFCFTRGWGAAGLWAGLCAALVVIGSLLLWVWRRKSLALRSGKA